MIEQVFNLSLWRSVFDYCKSMLSCLIVVRRVLWATYIQKRIDS